ncbi:3'-5' exonuclease [Candidatus Pacearchaeota archaeon]|nr:3'-5' exonuclease [Candidatus Pacearchaeota archaeon]
MIVLDIETSGGDYVENGIWQIGAIDIENPENYFLEEVRIDEGDTVNERALLIIGKTEEELRDKNKQSQKELIGNFLNWCDSIQNRDLLCHNPQFDQAFIKVKTMKYFKKDPFSPPNHHRAFDLHTIAQIKFFGLNKKFLLKGGNNDMGLRNTLQFCGLKDERGHHNALEDAKLTAECFSRLVHGKNLFPEFSKFEIPNYLKK